MNKIYLSEEDFQVLQKCLNDGVEAESLIETYHQRGSDELIHRAMKEFAMGNAASGR